MRELEGFLSCTGTLKDASDTLQRVVTREQFSSKEGMTDDKRAEFLEKIEYELERLKVGMTGKRVTEKEIKANVEKQASEIEKFTMPKPELPELKIDNGMKNVLIFGSIVAVLFLAAIYTNAIYFY